jgi:hypothetical protein
VGQFSAPGCPDPRWKGKHHDACRHVKGGRKLGNAHFGRGAMDVQHPRVRRDLGLRVIAYEEVAGASARSWRAWLDEVNCCTPVDQAGAAPRAEARLRDRDRAGGHARGRGRGPGRVAADDVPEAGLVHEALVDTAVRVGAVAKLAVKDLVHDGSQSTPRSAERGGKSRGIPARHDSEQARPGSLQAVGIAGGPLFRTANRKTRTLTCRMVKRRLTTACLLGPFSERSYRAVTVTDLLEQDVPPDDGQPYCLL